MKKLKVGAHAIEISKEDKIIFPKSKITKLQLVEYYQKITPFMLPYLKNRPISMQRFPNGINGDVFYQKDAPDYFPSYIKRVIVPKEEGAVHYPVANNEAALIYMATQLMVPHVWLSTSPKLHYPDHMIFDLDPSPGVTFAMIRWAAQELKTLLDELDLPAYIMTTGSRGVHIWVPLKKKDRFDFVHQFAHDIAQVLVHQYPEKLTIEMSKKKRGKRIFVDYLRNGFGATGVAPYSVRIIENAPVAIPFDWKELPRITPQKYTIKNIFRRLKGKKDPWAGMMQKAVSLKVARKVLDKILLEY